MMYMDFQKYETTMNTLYWSQKKDVIDLIFNFTSYLLMYMK